MNQMNEIRDAIEILEIQKSFCADVNIDVIRAYNLAIKSLEKQAFFENEVSHIHGWFVDNKEILLDNAMIVARDGFIESNVADFIDQVDLEFIASDIVDEIQKGILNVLSTYMDNQQL